MRRTSSVPCALEMRHSLRQFALCTHNNNGTNNFLSPICTQCATDLDSIAKPTDEIISSVARFSFALSDASITNDGVDLRIVAAAAASDVLAKATETRELHFTRFDECQREDVQSCNMTHQLGVGLCDTSHTNWVLESQRTGEIFLDVQSYFLDFTSGLHLARRIQKTVAEISQIGSQYNVFVATRSC